jgi:hypothetical protein
MGIRMPSSRSHVPRTLTLFTTMLVLVSSANAVTWPSRQIGRLLMPDSARDCVFFELVGVSQPDPAVPGTALIAVPKTQNGFKEIYALLLWAKATESVLTVETTGQPAGGGCSSLGNVVGLHQIYTPS